MTDKWAFFRKLLKTMPAPQHDYTITLSTNTPEQSPSPYGGFTPGDQATIFITTDGGWGYCFHGIGDTDLYSESDDVEGFKCATDAEAAAREDYADREEQFRQEAEWDAAVLEIEGR